MNSPSAFSVPHTIFYACLLLVPVLCFVSLAPPTARASRAPRAAAAPQADLAAGKTADNETVGVGGQITYTLSAFNVGTDDATNVKLVDTLPAHTTFVSADGGSGSVDFSNNTLTVTFDTLAAGDTAVATLVVSVDQDTPRGTTITNILDVSSDTADPDTSNNDASASTLVTGPYAGDLLISEFRLRGPGNVVATAPLKGARRTSISVSSLGRALPPAAVAPTPDTSPQANDEFIEIYNNTDTPFAVNTTDDSPGFAVAASDGVVRFTIPNGTVIPARGHFLGVNTLGYSLSAYAAGDSVLLPGNDTPTGGYTLDIPDNAGIAIFRTSDPANFSTATRLDAVGSTAEANPLYKEGAGYPALTPSNTDYAFVRDECGKNGLVTTFGPCPSHGLVVDTDNNAADFFFVDTAGTSAGAGQRLGAPGPQNLSSPTEQNNSLQGFNLDSTKSTNSPPNRVRDLTSNPKNNSTFGTLDLRRRITNNTGFPVTRLRFRVIDVSTFLAPSGIADLRALTSTAVVVTNVNDPATCGAQPAPCDVTVEGTTLEQPPTQTGGGGFNSSLSADTITLDTPLAPGDSVNVRFLLGIEQNGLFKFFVNIEALTDQSGGELSPRKALTQRPTATSRPVVAARPE